MTNSAATPSVLTAITCVVRASTPALLALDHVLQLLDEFVDVTLLSSLPKAAASGSVRWFNHVYQRTLGQSTLATSPRIDEDPLVEYTLSKAMKAAVKHGHTAIVLRIHALHPQRMPVRLLPIAAEAGDLAIFQWLLAHRSDDLCTLDYEPDARATVQFAPVETLNCCLLRPYRNALGNGQIHIVKWLLENGYTASNSYVKAGDKAALSGDLEMVEWLHINNIPHSFSKRAIDNAAKNGHVQVVQYLLTTRSEGFTSEAVHNAVMGGYDDIQELLRLSEVISVEEFESLGKWAYFAAAAGRLDLLESDGYTMDEGAAVQTMPFALQYGHLQVVQWLCIHHQGQPDPGIPALQGHLNILQWMHHHATLGSTNWGVAAMNCAAQNDHLAVVLWLHANRPEGGTTEAMDHAAKNGHLEVVQWLHGNRQEGCTANAMDCAAMNGHLAIVQWLHHHRTEGCTVRAMDLAATNNHLQVVEWLHIHRTEGCTTRAMTEATEKGHLEMVIWLHTHRQEGYTPVKLHSAPLSVLKWLHFNRHEGWTTAVMENAARHGDLATLEFLHQHRTEGYSRSVGIAAASSGHLYIVQWLHDKYPHDFDAASVAYRARTLGHRHIIDWLEDSMCVRRSAYYST